MRATPAIALLALGSCNSLLGVHDFPSDADNDVHDTLPTEGGVTDAHAGSCDPAQDFDAIVSIDELDDTSGTPANTSVTDIDALGTVIYLASDRRGKLQVYSARRQNTSDPFGPVGMLQTTVLFSTSWITVSPDASTGVIAAANQGETSDLYPVTSAGGDYATGAALALNRAGIDDTPRLTRDGKTLYLSSDRDVAPRLYTSREPFTSAQPLEGSGLGTSNESAPALTGDELVMYFTRRPTVKGSGDIYVVTRPDRTASFDNPIRVLGGISTSADETVGAVSPDGCALYFTRVDGASPHAHPYVATKRPR